MACGTGLAGDPDTCLFAPRLMALKGLTCMYIYIYICMVCDSNCYLYLSAVMCQPRSRNTAVLTAHG